MCVKAVVPQIRRRQKLGDRGQLKITNGSQSVYLYTHWAGSALPEILHTGIAHGIKGGRTLDGDPSYALGCIVRAFVVNTGGVDETTGFGVGFGLNDNDGRDCLLTLDMSEGTVQGTSGEPVKVNEFMKNVNSIGWNDD